MAILPVFLSGEFHGQKSLAGYRPWGHKESDTIEQLSTAQHTFIGASLVPIYRSRDKCRAHDFDPSQGTKIHVPQSNKPPHHYYWSPHATTRESVHHEDPA